MTELQDRLAHAEAMLKPLTSTSTSRDPQTTTESPWPYVPPSEPGLDPVQPHLLPDLGPSAFETGLNGFDSLANFTECRLDDWNNGIDWSSIIAPLPDIAPAQQSPSLITPIELGSSNGGIPFQQGFEPYTLANGTVSADDEVSAQDLNLMHHNYFEILYYVMPILSKQRFLSELTNHTIYAPVRGLSYGVALAGSTLSPKSANLQRICYSKAREYVELCERSDDGAELANLNVFQTLMFIIRYELTYKQLTRAWMTLGRAITLAKMLHLQQMDNTHIGSFTWDPEVQLKPMENITSMEEIRRSFWALYILDCYASIRTKRPDQFGEMQMDVLLPSAGHLDEKFTPSSMPFLSEALSLQGASQISSYAAIILMVRVARLCSSHVAITGTDAQGRGFWDRHYALVKRINDYTPLMQPHLSAKAVREDPLAFTLHINLCAVHMLLHEAAIGQVKEQELPKLVAAESRKCSTAAAFKLLSAVRMNWPMQRSEHDFFTIQATFIGWPLVMSMEVLCRSLLDSEDTMAMSVTDSLRILLAALDHVEESDGHWHKASAGAVATLQKCDEHQGGWEKGH